MTALEYNKMVLINALCKDPLPHRPQWLIPPPPYSNWPSWIPRPPTQPSPTWWSLKCLSRASASQTHKRGCSQRRTLMWRTSLTLSESSELAFVHLCMHVMYCIVGNFQGRKLCESVKNTIFVEKTFADHSLLPHQKMPRPKISQKNFSRITTKPRNSQKFFPLESFLLYGNCGSLR